MSPICEQKSLLPDNNLRLGDFSYLYRIWVGQQFLGVTVFSSLRPSLIANAALSAAEDRKYKQYAQKCRDVGFQLIPLVFELFGVILETVRKILST